NATRAVPSPGRPSRRRPSLPSLPRRPAASTRPGRSRSACQSEHAGRPRKRPSRRAWRSRKTYGRIHPGNGGRHRLSGLLLRQISEYKAYNDPVLRQAYKLQWWRMRLLVVEDNAKLCELLAQGLAVAGFESDRVSHLAAAQEALAATS